MFTKPSGEAIAALRKPAVNVSGVLPEMPFPRVEVDHEGGGPV
jgi:hypothetical protein